MRILIALSCLAVLSMVSSAAGEQYTDRYDRVNLDEILANRRLLVPYMKCMLDLLHCTPEGRELKLHIKEAMQNSCSKCTPVQKKGARKVVKHIRENESEHWELLKKKYDPDNAFKETYEAFLAADD